MCAKNFSKHLATTSILPNTLVFYGAPFKFSSENATVKLYLLVYADDLNMTQQTNFLFTNKG